MRPIRTLWLSVFASGLLTMVTTVGAEEQIGWRDQSGKTAAETEFRKTKNGFGGWLIVTPDADWQQKWNTSPETVPRFTASDTVERGKELFILTFFTNPKTDVSGNANVTGDYEVIRPDGSYSVHEKDAPCFRTKIVGSPYNIHLGDAILKYIAEPKDLAGKWNVRVTLKDNNRHTRLVLKTSFTVK